MNANAASGIRMNKLFKKRRTSKRAASSFCLKKKYNGFIGKFGAYIESVLIKQEASPVKGKFTLKRGFAGYEVEQSYKQVIHGGAQHETVCIGLQGNR